MQTIQTLRNCIKVTINVTYFVNYLVHVTFEDEDCNKNKAMPWAGALV